MRCLMALACTTEDPADPENTKLYFVLKFYEKINIYTTDLLDLDCNLLAS